MQSLPGATPGCILFCGRALRSLKSRLDYRVIHRLRIRRSLPPTLGTSSTNERVSIVNDRSLFLSLSFSLTLPLFSLSSSLFRSSLLLSVYLSFSTRALFLLASRCAQRSFLKRIPIKRARMSSYVLFTGKSVGRDITGTTGGHCEILRHTPEKHSDTIVGEWLLRVSHAEDTEYILFIS